MGLKNIGYFMGVLDIVGFDRVIAIGLVIPLLSKFGLWN